MPEPSKTLARPLVPHRGAALAALNLSAPRQSVRPCAAVPIVVRKRTRGGNMRRIAGLALTCGALVSCTSVKMVQREGCWVKQTERTFGGSSEELGFCTRARPQWAEDRLARLGPGGKGAAGYRWEKRGAAAGARRGPV